MKNQDDVINLIECPCGSSFCFKCGELSHMPCDCKMAEEWILKSQAESENLTWIMANTKRCPKCTKPIEKNQGCNHMKCQQCGHDFCWVCEGPWKEHGSATGGYYKCNKYEEMKKDTKLVAEEKAREDAKNELNRYMFYYERYENHNKSEGLAKKLRPVIKRKID